MLEKCSSLCGLATLSTARVIASTSKILLQSSLPMRVQLLTISPRVAYGWWDGAVNLNELFEGFGATQRLAVSGKLTRETQAFFFFSHLSQEK